MCVVVVIVCQSWLSSSSLSVSLSQVVLVDRSVTLSLLLFLLSPSNCRSVCESRLYRPRERGRLITAALGEATNKREHQPVESTAKTAGRGRKRERVWSGLRFPSLFLRSDRCRKALGCRLERECVAAVTLSQRLPRTDVSASKRKAKTKYACYFCSFRIDPDRMVPTESR